ncbi:hypothetical protein L249_5309 [Ophiocordyceps polyrhachis-furcata BCC 54312]|uniref:Uncharacterized protein n=1 Tax=Ophiocordyceps polyrhachis-furcata BCC 54312 TaxID=1330021 RepID=A0A367L8G9_9HYPO|nr:hypothetical protein L249_5309 [Ophiocordyceps polyrhachis-furcata BCC 54312]
MYLHMRGQSEPRTYSSLHPSVRSSQSHIQKRKQAMSLYKHTTQLTSEALPLGRDFTNYYIHYDLYSHITKSAQKHPTTQLNSTQPNFSISAYHPSITPPTNLPALHTKHTNLSHRNTERERESKGQAYMYVSENDDDTYTCISGNSVPSRSGLPAGNGAVPSETTSPSLMPSRYLQIKG